MKVIKSKLSTKETVQNLMQLYLHDLSEFSDDQINCEGQFDYGEYFHLYWEDKDRLPYLCIDNDSPIGFALVRKLSKRSFSMAEFFILKTHRGKGIATLFAHEIFKLHHGQWSVAEIESNLPAQTFWRKTIGLFTDNHYEEVWSSSQPIGPMQIFNTLN